jgi:hypothetical protein
MKNQMNDLQIHVITKNGLQIYHTDWFIMIVDFHDIAELLLKFGNQSTLINVNFFEKIFQYLTSNVSTCDTNINKLLLNVTQRCCEFEPRSG